MKHKYKVFRFVNGKQVCEWREEEINPILYLNDYYNFLDTDNFENAYGHGKGSKKYTYEVLEKHLKALEIIISKKTNIAMLFWYFKYKQNYEKYVEAFNELSSDYNEEMLTLEEYNLLKEVLL